MKTKRMEKRSHMSAWSSTITPQRARALGEIIQKIEQVSQNPVNRQTGNVIGDLRNIGEFQLIDELKHEIELYNQSVDDFNKEVDYVNEVYYQLSRFKGNRERWQDAFASAFPGGILGSYEEFEGESYRAVSVFTYHWSHPRDNPHGWSTR